jgi:uncharacterized protein (TIGR00369 family)
MAEYYDDWSKTSRFELMTLADLFQPHPGFRLDLARAIEAMPSSRLLGLKVLGFHPEGRSAIEMPIARSHTFDGTIVQGGLVGTLADYAGVSAAACTLPEGWIASTTGFEVHNLAPARGERLIAYGSVQHMGKSQGISRAEVFAMSEQACTLVCVATTLCKPLNLNA